MNELQRFPVLRKRMDEVIGDFLRNGLEPSEAMIGDIIDMEVCIINWNPYDHLRQLHLNLSVETLFVFREERLIVSDFGCLGLVLID